MMMRDYIVLVVVAFLQLSCTSQPLPRDPMRAVIRVGDRWDDAVSLIESAGGARDEGADILTSSRADLQAELMDEGLGVPKLPLRQAWRVDGLIVILRGDSPAWTRRKQGRITRIEIGELRIDGAPALFGLGLKEPLRKVDSVSVAAGRGRSTPPAAIGAARGAFHGEWASKNGKLHFVIEHQRGQTPVVRNPNDKKWRPEKVSLANGVLQWETGRYLILKKGWRPATFDVNKTGHPFATMREKEFLRVDPANSSRLLFYMILPDGKVHLDWPGPSLELKSRKIRSGQLDRTLLSAKARGFVTSVRDDASNFVLRVDRWGYRPQRGIAFSTGRRLEKGMNAVEISRSEAIRIVDFFAGKGLLDKSEGLPCGMVVGWYLTLSTGRDNHVTRFLGIGKHALLGRGDVLGVRGVLGSKTAEKWDAFVDQVRKELTGKKKVEANSE